MRSYYVSNIAVDKDSIRELLDNGKDGDFRLAVCVAKQIDEDCLIYFVNTNGNPVYLGWSGLDGGLADVEQSDWDFDADGDWFTPEDLRV